MRNEKGQFVKGNQEGKLYWFKKGHRKPKNAYKFPKGHIPVMGFKKGNKLCVGREPWNKGKEMPQIKGSKNSAWKGGITPEHRLLRASSKNDWWVKGIFKRDNYTCQKCKIRGEKLCAHHIQNFADYPRLRFEVDNGIAFCVKCHKLFHKLYGFKNNKQQIYDYLPQM